MSGKQMKKLRRRAEAKSVGKPWVTGGLSMNCRTTVVLSPKSGRGIYQALKKEQNDGSR